MRPAIILTLLAFLPASADEVTLENGSRLSGTVTGLSDTGELLLESDLSFEPFRVRAESVRQATFTTVAPPPDPHDALVILGNGDLFAGDLTGMDETTVTLSTSFAGELRIPREKISTIQLGVRPRKTVYTGPAADEPSGWTLQNGWQLASGRFTSQERGILARKFDTPGSFALKFRISWRNSPNLRIFFASESLETTGKNDRYLLQFGSLGFELKRQQSGDGSSYLPVATINRLPQEFQGSAVEVELLVDRKMGVVHLFLDGEEEGHYSDPLKRYPTGQGVIIESLLGGNDLQSISGIEVSEWDPSSPRHRKEDRGDETKDAVITRSSDRGTVSILGIHGTGADASIRYKSPHHPQPVDLPLSEISTVFFAQTADEDAPAHPPLKLTLGSRGALRVSRCTFTGDAIQALHPLLGELSIRRAAVASLTRSAAKPVEDEEPAEETPEEESDEE